MLFEFIQRPANCIWARKKCYSINQLRWETYRRGLVARQQSIVILLLARLIIDGVLDAHFFSLNPSVSFLSRSLSLFLFLSSIPVQRKPKISGRWEKSSEWKIESTSSFTRRSIRAQRGSWHTFVVTERQCMVFYDDFEGSLAPSPVAVSRVGHSSEPNEEEPCRRPGKTRFPGNCTRVRNPAAATKVAVDRGFPLLLAHRSCALGPDPPCPKDDLLISRLPAELCLAIFG